MENNNYIELIKELKKIKGSLSYDGEASCQVLLPTKNNTYLRVGITDSDAGSGKLWFDYYKGLNNEINKPVETTNEQPGLCSFIFNYNGITNKNRPWCDVYKGKCKCKNKG